MSLSSFLAQARQHLTVGTSLFALLVNLGASAPVAAQQVKTASPIKHVIVIIGENRSFDHVFATYKPKKGETVSNLLSKGIITEDGTPGPNYSLAAQYSAVDSTTVGAGTYAISPPEKTIYTNIPPVVAGGPTKPFLPSLALAKEIEPGQLFPSYYVDLTIGGTGLPAFVVADTRIPDVFHLPEGAFQLTSPTLTYNDYANSPVHRFFQMWQQTDCSVGTATADNPSGCLSDLFPWVEVTIGAGSDGSSGSASPPTGYLSTGEGSTSMEFFNVLKGDAPYMKKLADEYTLSDNFHQSVMGGTMANHIEFGFADSIWYSDGKGKALTPPANQIENPDPQPGTNNYYTQDGYGGGSGGPWGYRDDYGGWGDYWAYRALGAGSNPGQQRQMSTRPDLTRGRLTPATEDLSALAVTGEDPTVLGFLLVSFPGRIVFEILNVAEPATMVFRSESDGGLGVLNRALVDSGFKPPPADGGLIAPLRRVGEPAVLTDLLIAAIPHDDNWSAQLAAALG